MCIETLLVFHDEQNYEEHKQNCRACRTQLIVSEPPKIKKKQSTSPKTCRLCNKYFPCSTPYRNHFPNCSRETIQSLTEFPCTLFNNVGCDKVFETYMEYKIHRRIQHPKEPTQRESDVVEFLVDNNIAFDFQYVIDLSWTDKGFMCAHIDFCIKNNALIFLEIDEYQHVGKFDEDWQRMQRVNQSVRDQNGQRQILWIRFNPDRFSVNWEPRIVSYCDRVRKLQEVIESHEIRQPVEVIYMFYSVLETDSKLSIPANQSNHPIEKIII